MGHHRLGVVRDAVKKPNAFFPRKIHGGRRVRIQALGPGQQHLEVRIASQNAGRKGETRVYHKRGLLDDISKITTAILSQLWRGINSKPGKHGRNGTGQSEYLSGCFSICKERADQTVNQTTIHPYKRGVSIIGVGCTPFMYTVDHEETNGLTEGEMFGYAALKAMEDAGCNPQNVDFYFHGQASPLNGSNYLTPNVHVTNWFGMKGKASIHHSEACCTGYYAIEEAVNAIASGKYDCVLSGCVEFGDSLAVGNHPYKREKMTMDKFLATTSWLYERPYTRSLMAGQELIYDDAAEWYKRTRGLTDQEMDDTLNWMCINNRRNASKNPLAIERKTYEEYAKEAGFDDVMEYMRSPYNPRMGDFLRAGGIEIKCDGAAAVLVCATELVDKFMGNKSHKPIEVLGVGAACCEASTPHFEVRATEEAVRQVYEVTGLSGDDIDIFYANDFIITSHLVSAEIAGYLPYGEGWKYICAGRTAYDGDKPINTNGGRTSFGHAHAASGLADLYECVRQMRGEAGEGQVKRIPKTAMLRGYGGAQNICTYIIRTAD